MQTLMIILILALLLILIIILIWVLLIKYLAESHKEMPPCTAEGKLNMRGALENNKKHICSHLETVFLISVFNSTKRGWEGGCWPSGRLGGCRCSDMDQPQDGVTYSCHDFKDLPPLSEPSLERDFNIKLGVSRSRIDL